MKKSKRNRYFRIGERVYNCDYIETKYMGFATIVDIDGVAENGYIMEENIPTIRMEETGEVITGIGCNIYKIAPRISKKCGETVCYEHNETQDNYPYFIPANDENYFKFELGALSKMVDVFKL